MTSIGKRIRELRVAKGISQSTLAAGAGITQPSLSQIESGATESLSATTLDGLSKALGVTHAQLLHGEFTNGSHEGHDVESPEGEIHLGRRIQMRLDELGWRQADLLARLPELPQSTLAQLVLRNGVASQWSDEIAETLGVEHRWLQRGTGPKLRRDWVPEVEPKSVLWQSVSRLMIWRYGNENLTRLAAETGLGPGTCSRIKEQRTEIGLRVMTTIAQHFGFQPWQLLVPGFDPANPPTLSVLDVNSDEQELLGLYRKLDEDTRPALLNRARSLQE